MLVDTDSVEVLKFSVITYMHGHQLIIIPALPLDPC